MLIECEAAELKGKIKTRLKLIRKAIEQEKVSMGDVAFLTAHQTEIKEYFPDDVVLWEWAGIPEEEWNERS